MLLGVHALAHARPLFKRIALPGVMAGGRVAGEQAQEPVWLVRALLLLFFAAFAVFLARELERIAGALP